MKPLVIYSSFEETSRAFMACAPEGFEFDSLDWSTDQESHTKHMRISSFPTIFLGVIASGVETGQEGTMQSSSWDQVLTASAGVDTGFGLDNQSFFYVVTDAPAPEPDTKLFLDTLAGDIAINSGTFLICELIASAPSRYAALTANLSQATKDKIAAAALLANIVH